MRHSKSHATDSPSPTSSRAWRKNRSRRSRAAEAEALDDASPKAAEEPEGQASGSLPILSNADPGTPVSADLAARIDATLTRALRPFSARLTRVEVNLGQTALGSRGVNETKCSVEARIRGQEPVTASARSRSAEVALHQAANKLKRALRTRLGRTHKGASTIRR